MNTENTLIIQKKIFRSLLFAALGVLMSLLSFAVFFFDFFEADTYMRIIGLFGFIFFIICTILIIKVRFKNKNVLVVNSEGITDKSSAIALGFIPWHDVKNMKIRSVNGNKFIEVQIDNEALHLERLKQWQRKAIEINREMGQEAVLINLAFTGHKPEDVLNVMQEIYLQAKSNLE